MLFNKMVKTAILDKRLYSSQLEWIYFYFDSDFKHWTRFESFRDFEIFHRLESVPQSFFYNLLIKYVFESGIKKTTK